MKIRLSMTFCTMLLLCAAISYAGQRVEAGQPNYDFGTIPQGQLVEHVFIIRNIGDKPLTIKAVRPSCGCTAAQVSAKVVNPGQSSRIKATFNSTNFPGSIHKTIAVETDDPRQHMTTLSLTGVVIEEIVISPRQVNFGLLKSGASKTVTISLANNGKRPLRILSVKSHLPQVRVQAYDQVAKQGKPATITVSAAPHGNAPSLSGFISIMTDNPARTEIIVPLFASVANTAQPH